MRTPETYPLEGELEDIEARLSYLGILEDSYIGICIIHPWTPSPFSVSASAHHL